MEIPVSFDDHAMDQIKAVMLSSARDAFKQVSAQKGYSRYMNIKTASKYAGVAENTFRKKFIAGGLRIVTIDGIQRIDRIDLDKFMESKKM